MRGLPRCVNYDKTAAHRRFLNTRLRGAEWPLSGAGAEDVPLIAVSCGPAKSVLYIYISKERTPRSGLPVPGCIGVRGVGGTDAEPCSVLCSPARASFLLLVVTPSLT